MAFKEPGKSPWEKSTQPNIDEFLNLVQNRFKKNLSFTNIWVLVVVVALVGAVWSGFYRVKPGELAVIRRFGKITVTQGEGVWMHWPWPVEQDNVVKVREIRRMELGFRQGRQGASRIPRGIPAESLMITGDENLVNIWVVIQYHIGNVTDFLFRVWDPEGTPEGRTLRDAAETALRGVVGSMDIDAILTVGRAEVQEQTKVHLQELLDSYNTGILVTEVKLQAVEPPQPVDAAFKDVVSAKEDRERIINEAEAYREDLLPKARGEAEKMVQDAEAYKEARIREATGESERFLANLNEYRKAKAVTRQRLYLETMQVVLSNVEKVIISAEVGGKSLPLLPLLDYGRRESPQREGAVR